MTSRRSFLKYGAAAAGAIALPTLLTASGASGSNAVPDLLANDTFPIGFFWPPPVAETTAARYQQIADAGFTWVSGGNDVFNWTASQKMLQAAEQTNLVALPVDDRVGRAKPCPGWEAGVRQAWDQYAGSPAFGGFRVIDEPSPVDYPRLRMIEDVLTGFGPDKLTHFNVVPVYNVGAGAQYQQFLARYLDQIAPSFLSFDHYPLFTDGTVRASYFLNWALIRQAGLGANLPTWTYIQAVDHWNLKSPTRAELQWQLSMSLAYGAKGIQYFTYWTPVGTSDFVFGAALIDKQGKPTRLYSDAKDFNNSYLQPIGRQLKHLVSESVVHAGESPLPPGAAGFTPSTQLASVSGGPVVLGQFRQAVDDGVRRLFVANRSYANATTVTITLRAAVGEVTEFNTVTGQYDAVPLGSTGAGRTLTASIAAGAGRLFRLAPASFGAAPA